MAEARMDVENEDEDMDTTYSFASSRLPRNMIMGENGSPAYISNTSKNVHFFFNVVKTTPEPSLREILEDAYRESPDICIRLIFNLGNVRKDGAGKQDKTNFLRALLWSWTKDPEILILNVGMIHKHTSLQTLLNLLMYILYLNYPESDYNLESQMKRSVEHKAQRKKIRNSKNKKDARAEKKAARAERWSKFADSLGVTLDSLRISRDDKDIKMKEGVALEKRKNDPRVSSKWKNEVVEEKFKEFCSELEKERVKKFQAETKNKKQKTLEAIRKSREDPNFVKFFEGVVDVFCTGLKEEFDQVTEFEKTGRGQVGGLFGKWAPTYRGMHDKATEIARAIMKKLLPQLGLGDGSGANNGHQNYHKVLSRIHRAAQVPEHYVGQGKWGDVNYNRMASRCRFLNGQRVFKKHDKERYEAYVESSAKTILTNVTAKEGVKTGVLLPHEVTAKANDYGLMSDPNSFMELQLQWWGMVKSCREAIKSGKSGPGFCLPMCDTSGSMNGEPMEVAIALSLLLAESTPTDSPFHGLIMTFSTNPRLLTPAGIPDYETAINPDTLHNVTAINAKLGNLKSRVDQVRGYEWHGSTNIEAAYMLLLKTAKEHKLSQEFVRDIKLVVLSDMEFDQATGGYRSRSELPTMYQRFTQIFREAGYTYLPKTVFWNLRHSSSQPVTDKEHPDVIKLSGFSAGLLRNFLKGDLDEFTPYGQMLQVISGPLYMDLRAPE